MNMTYRRPKGVKLTDMAIYIDSHIYSNDYDEDKVFIYLYHIVCALSKILFKGEFTNNETCDAFGIYFATVLFFRLTNPKQFEYDEEGNAKLPQVKSILNYIKSAIRLRWNEFKKNNGYCEKAFKEEIAENFNISYFTNSSLSNIYLSDFKLTTGSICSTCEKFMDSLPFIKDSKERQNVYFSILLTFLSHITPTEGQRNRLKSITQDPSRKDYYINNIFTEIRNSNLVLYHLPSSMSSYIIVLTRRFEKIIARELTEILHEKEQLDYEELSFMIMDKETLENEYEYGN